MREELVLPGAIRKDYQAGEMSQEVYNLLCIIFANFLEEEFSREDILEVTDLSEEKVKEGLAQVVETDYITQAPKEEEVYQVNDFYRQGVKLALAQMEDR
ncbi:hypothetical protein [Halanaerobaculum tunisiense]